MPKWVTGVFSKWLFLAISGGEISDFGCSITDLLLVIYVFLPGIVGTNFSDIGEISSRKVAKTQNK
ncbi:hypothetical protein FHS10_000432 [Mucilaginibacter dorajii]|uniref:Holin n=1 Tax=Mucilaginibacter dorajii TaxID=692994 RepID=A0ABP7QW62_9SPHI|nr:hypothetical protein [Mucilaginibacter dorajii]MCS3732510.1 hypothetical protein [Mucilaginibacter dorajii]